jgi:hypothetical protein
LFLGETFLFQIKPYAKMYPWVGRDISEAPVDMNDEAAVKAANERENYIKDKASRFIQATKRDITIGGGG